MIIKNYNLFLEARLFDLVNLKSDKSNIEKSIKFYQEMDFDFSSKLIKYITLNKRRNGEKIRMLIQWNHDAEHDLQKRIQNRTSFKTIDEFNEYFTLVINKLFPDKIGDTIFSSGKYSIYDRELNITISMAFNIGDYLSKKYKLIVVTILSGRKSDNKTVKILDI